MSESASELLRLSHFDVRLARGFFAAWARVERVAG